MSKRRRIVFAFACFALGLILWVALYPGFKKQTFTFEDGSALTLLDVTYGTNHQAPLSSWQDLVQLAPEPLRRRLGIGPRFTWRTPKPTAFAWVQPSESMSLISYRVESLDGIQHELDPARIAQTPPYMVALRLPTFPRRDSAFFIVAPPKDPLARDYIRLFKIRNPAPGDYPQWEGEALPAARQQAGYTFELMHLQLATNSFEVHGGLRVLDEGEVSKSWAILGITTSDPTGNTVSPKTLNSWGVDQAAFVYRWPLFADEVWKIRLQLTRLPSATFRDEELWTAPALSVPELLAETPITNVSHAIGGATVRVLSIIPEPGFIELKVEIHPADDHRLDVVKVVDESGRELSTHWRSIQENPSTFYIVTPGPPTPAPKTIQVTFALHRSVFVEYLVEPELVGEGQEGLR